jgi:hypothetical protein
MTRLMLVVCAASLALSSVRADEVVRTCASYKTYKEFSFHRFHRGYEESLDFPVPVVVESTLREVALIKLAQPDLECTKVYEKVCELASIATTPAVRYKASLVRMIFDFPEMFVGERGREYRNDEEVFTALQDRLHSSALVLVR